MRSDYATRSMRNTLPVVASTAAIVALLVLTTNARASDCVPRVFTLSEEFDAADSIIVGFVTECEEDPGRELWTDGGRDCSFVSLDVLKESGSARDYGGISSSSGCGLSLQVGKQYLLFLDNENTPMHYSASLDGEHYRTELMNSYQRILREFRDGVIRDLSEPWLFSTPQGTCLLSHSVGGHRISFGGGISNAEEQSAEGWTVEKVDGKTIHRGQTSAVSSGSSTPLLDAEVVVVSEIPEYPIDAQYLFIELQEQTPAPVRQATITVGDRSWQLYRVETLISINGMPSITDVRYKVGGEVSEQILSAMSKPSDIVVSAVLVNSPNVDFEALPEVSQMNQGSVSQAPKGDSFSQVIPETGSMKPKITTSVGAIRAYGSREMPPEPVIRLETVSTQLPAVLESYRVCNVGAPKT